MLGYAGEGDRVLEDVHSKVGVKLLHLLQRFQKGGHVQVVVVLQPVAEGSHAPLAEDLVTGVVLLKREYIRALELGIPGQVGGKTGKVQLGWAVKPLVWEPGLGKGGAVCLDPLVVSDARGQIVQHIQELELGGGDEHDATVLLRCVDVVVLDHERDKVLVNELEIIVARVETQNRHLGDPLCEPLALALGDFLWVRRGVPLLHIRYDRCMATLEGLTEAMD